MEVISNRTSVVKNDKDLSIVISASADKRKNNLLLAWLVAWTLCGGYIIYNYFQLTDNKMKVMTLIWIAFWLYFEYTIAKAWQWKRFGKEVIKVKDGKLSMKRDIQGRGIVYSFDARHISDIRKFEDKTPGWLKKLGEEYWSIGGESLSFRHEQSEIKFGFQLSGDESGQLISLLKYYVKMNAAVKEEK
ncbi:MAG: hypothetical protein FD123_2192 [Bacteroidetes bacterium]|nr:MAG: hypothetical protein FD123_2192 [Bacteroidota bacterium]